MSCCRRRALRPPRGRNGRNPPPEVPGTVIGHFRLVRLLGEGGMGSVWQAEQTAPVRRTVALKLIKLGMDTREVVRRFERERQTLAFLNHPNIAQVFEAGATALGRPFFAMEFVAGQPVTTYGDAAGLDVEARLRLFRDVCSAVEHAHQKGVIHRDLKPSNILVADGVVKVIDFGVAKATQGLADPLFTQPAQILGTPAYMSPEQARSAGADVDTRTDVYALGVVLYEILTGALPIDPARFAGTTLAGMHQILMETEPPTPSDRVAARRVQGRSANPDPRPRSAPRGELDWVVMKAIRKDREERYAGAAALSEDLRRYLAGEPVAAAPLTLGYLFEKFVRRHRSAVVAALVVTGALVAGTVVSAWQAVRAVRAQRETTLTVADMHTRSGLAAAGHGEASWAALWMANAAVIARDDPQRVEANRRRAAAWRQEIMPPVRARETGFDYVGQMSWNPRLPRPDRLRPIRRRGLGVGPGARPTLGSRLRTTPGACNLGRGGRTDRHADRLENHHPGIPVRSRIGAERGRFRLRHGLQSGWPMAGGGRQSRVPVGLEARRACCLGKPGSAPG
jgi:hypothetical protein